MDTIIYIIGYLLIGLPMTKYLSIWLYNKNAYVIPINYSGLFVLYIIWLGIMIGIPVTMMICQTTKIRFYCPFSGTERVLLKIPGKFIAKLLKLEDKVPSGAFYFVLILYLAFCAWLSQAQSLPSNTLSTAVDRVL
ncbi:hypothetical protein AMJ49_05465 [Parcubacteria bacterium DG_74_2]|nr:MAG: hypothetical protein AMJ49_05465 [Parcubacteria bacterium DG_74_2]